MSSRDNSALLVFPGPVSGDLPLDGHDRALAVPSDGLDTVSWLRGPVDVDADGYPDLVISVDDAHSGRIVLASGPFPGDLDLAARASFVEGDPLTHLGPAVEAEDLDADGVADLVVGSRDDAASSGAVLVWFGPIRGSREPATADVRIIGDRTGDELGAGFAIGAYEVQDFDPDVFALAPFAAPRTGAFGAAYLIPDSVFP